MDEITNRGGAGPAIAAHSKDASAPGNTPASSTTSSPANGKSWHGESVGKIGDTLSDLRVQAVDHLTNHVREKPLAAVALTGLAFLAMGILLGRKRL